LTIVCDPEIIILCQESGNIVALNTRETSEGKVSRLFFAVAFVFLGAPMLSSAQTPNFCEGKQVTIIVGDPAGFSFDAYARLVGRHIHRHIPGNPNITVQNMPGAGSFKAAQYLANVAPKGAVAGVVGIEVGVVSGVINLDSSDVEASDRRRHHDNA